MIAVQVENGYGSYAKDEAYMLFVKKVIYLHDLNSPQCLSKPRQILLCSHTKI